MDFLHTTRASYDAFADEYSARFQDELAAKPLDRAMVTAFAELVLADGGGPVADVGCGTGRVTGHLHGLGVDAFGIDLSPQMLAEARRHHPGLRFEEGSMLGLDLPDGSLGGLLAWYSTIHVPDEQLPTAFAEFFRVLAPGGYVLLGFQAGDGVLHLEDAFGREISLDFHRRRPETVADLLEAAGLTMRARLARGTDTESAFPERTPQAFLLARKPTVGGGKEDGGPAEKGGPVGTWGMGHFDSDTAADFAGSLDDARPGRREELIREALAPAARTGTGEYLDTDDGVLAVAAAALLAAQRPGGVPVDSVYGPDDPLPPLAPELCGLAVTALDRVVAGESALPELWADVGEGERWGAGVRELRAVLAGTVAPPAAQRAAPSRRRPGRPCGPSGPSGGAAVPR